MSPLLHLKAALVVAYAALCTHLVLRVLQAEPGTPREALQALLAPAFGP